MGCRSGAVGDYAIAIASTLATNGQVTGLFQFVDDALNGAFGDAHLLGDLAQDKIVLGIYQDQYMGVIGQKGPAVSAGPLPGRPRLPRNAGC